MEYYLELRFRNAGWFNSKEASRDWILGLNDRDSRCSGSNKKYVEPITKYQINNMLCVLMGERPKPSIRKVFDDAFIINSKILNFVENGFLKINPYYVINKWEKKLYFNETIKTNKAVYDSTRNYKTTMVCWKRIKKHLGTELYGEFINTLKNVLSPKDVFSYTAIECFDLLASNPDLRINEFEKKLRALNKAPIPNLLCGGSNASHKLNETRNTYLGNVNGITKVTKLSGTIIIPIDEWGKNKISNSSGCATLLDGGIVGIVKITHNDNFYDSELDGFVPIKDISTDMVCIEK